MKGATRKGTEGVKEELFKKSAKQVSQRGVKSISGKALGTTIAGGVASGVVLEGIGVVAEEVLKRTEAMSQEDALSYIGQLIGVIARVTMLAIFYIAHTERLRRLR
jgi:hypothetical protein